MEDTHVTRTRILSYIRAYAMAKQIAPSLDDIATELGINKSTVKYHVSSMAEDGLITREKVNGRARPRTMAITAEGRAYLNGN